tara:strand:- start:13 stop:1683 length:1671 start_codon:yes stop_codon:yes gene_type:complete
LKTLIKNLELVLNIFTLKNLYKLIYLTSVYITSVIIFVSYDITLSPDFEKYINYFEFYSGSLNQTGLEQGHIYFFFTYLVKEFLELILDFKIYIEVLNLSIHFSNSLLFFIGLQGFKNLLREYNFDLNKIYLSLSLMAIFPPGLVLRMSFKPEIFAFSSLGWIFYFLIKYKKTKNENYLLRFILITSLILTSKGSIAVMLFLILLIHICLKHKYLFSRKLIKFYILSFLIVLGLLFENTNLNGIFINEVNHNENYDNQATYEFFTYFNYDDFKNNPNKYFHYESFIGITLFDTFNDFFGLYWNSEYTKFNTERKNFIIINEKIDRTTIPNLSFNKTTNVFTYNGSDEPVLLKDNFLNDSRNRVSFKFSILFYSLLILFSIYKKHYAEYMLSSFLGLIIIGLSAKGLFGNNFDPLVGDSVKTFYYSFFISLSFLFLINSIFRYVNLGNKTITFLLAVLFMFFIGFPHSLSTKTEESIIYKNTILPTCYVNQIFLQPMYGIDYEFQCDAEQLENYSDIQMSNSIEKLFTLNNIPYLNIFLLVGVFLLILQNKKKILNE